MPHHMDGQNAVILSYRHSWEESGAKLSSSPLHEVPSVIQRPTSDHILQHCRLQAVLNPLMKNGNNMFFCTVWYSFFMCSQLSLPFVVVF